MADVRTSRFFGSFVFLVPSTLVVNVHFIFERYFPLSFGHFLLVGVVNLDRRNWNKLRRNWNGDGRNWNESKKKEKCYEYC